MRKTTNIDLLAAIVYTTVPGAAKEMDKFLNIPPSDCSKCSHSLHTGGGHCYMFRTKPDGNCAQYKPIKPRNTGATEAK